MSLLIKHFYRFGAFTLDTDQRVLFREDKPVPLTPKVFDTLLVLVENKGRIVEKDELMSRLWPDTFVEEANLTFNIKQLRKLLGDDARQPVFVETVTRRGYRFIANVEELLTDDDVGQITRRIDSPETPEPARQRIEAESAARSSEPMIESRPATAAPVTAVDASSASAEVSPAVPGVNSVASSRGTTRPLTSVSAAAAAEQAGGHLSKREIILFAGFLILLLAVALLFYVLNRSAGSPVTTGPFQNVKLRNLTNLGNATAAAISPDGKFISYAVNENGNYSLWTKAIATGSAVEIVPATGLGIRTTTFSPDGEYVYYLVISKDFRTVLNRIPVLGGKSIQIKPDVGNDVASFSPDGRQFTYARLSPDLSESQLYVAAIEGEERRIISSRPSSNPFTDGPSWSPDGNLIAVGSRGAVLLVSVATGEVKPLTQEQWDFVGRVTWLKDGSGVAVAGQAKGEDRAQIWHVAYPGGEIRRITNDLVDYDQFCLSVTSNNRVLVTVQQQAISSIWVSPDGSAARARQLIARANSYDGVDGLAWASSGKIIYTSRVSGRLNLWGTDREGNNTLQLTSSAGSDSLPCVSPDGRYVVFLSNRSGKRDLWRADIDGSNEFQLTTGARVSTPTVSSDGRWVIYTKVEDSVARETDLWRVPIEGGNPTRVTDFKFAGYPAVSPDNKWIAFYKFDTQDRKTKVVIIPFDGGAPVKTLVFTFDPLPWLRWSADGRSLIYNDTNDGATNLWRLPIDGGAPQQITDFKSEQIWNFDLARDGKQIAVARGNLTTDVVLISSEQ